MVPQRTQIIRPTGRIFGITVHQPWAWAIAAGHAPVENRDWEPDPSMCPAGTWLAIHAGKRCDPQQIEWIWQRFGLRIEAQDLVSGAVIALARFVGVRQTMDSPWFLGPIGWELAGTTPVKPVPCRGWPKLWSLSRAVRDELREQLIEIRARRGSPIITQTSDPRYPWDNQ